MPRKLAEQPKFNFEEDGHEAPITQDPEYQRVKAKNAEEVVLGQAAKDVFDKVYTLLSAQEQRELQNLKTASERREYVVRKYSKLFGPPS